MKDSTFWEVTVPRVMNIYANAVFVVLWVGFFVALIVNRDWLDQAWEWVQALPAAPRIFIWLVFLPVMVLLWIWESSWSPFWHVLGYAGVVGWTVVAVVNILKAYK